MDYRVIETVDALDDLERCVYYLLFEKKSIQAADRVLKDHDETITRLSNAAGSLAYCGNPKLAAMGYKRINFKEHNYFMLFRIEEDVATIDRIFHGTQDYENKLL